MSAQPTTAQAKPALTGAKPSLISLIRRDRAWIIMMILPLLYFALFRYLPLYGMVIAFKDYSVGRGIWGSEWVGLKWFLQFFNSFYFWRLVRNTFLISFYMLLFGFPVPILFALCLNEVRSVGFRRTVQTVSYLPYFISVVVVVGMMVNFVSINGGIINVIIARLGGTPVNFMNEVGWFRPMYVLSEIWQDFGFGSIIYLAAIAGIDEELYDAAEVDGCSRWQRMRWIDFVRNSEEAITIQNWGVEGLTYRVVDGKKEFIPTDEDISLNERLLQIGAGQPPYPHLQVKQAWINRFPGWIFPLDEKLQHFYIEPFPPIASTKEEIDTINEVRGDLVTYYNEMKDKFIVGQESIDEKWDEYLQTVARLGSDRFVQVYQQKWDRYLDIVGGN